MREQYVFNANRSLSRYVYGNQVGTEKYGKKSMFGGAIMHMFRRKKDGDGFPIYVSWTSGVQKEVSHAAEQIVLKEQIWK